MEHFAGWSGNTADPPNRTIPGELMMSLNRHETSARLQITIRRRCFHGSSVSGVAIAMIEISLESVRRWPAACAEERTKKKKTILSAKNVNKQKRALDIWQPDAALAGSDFRRRAGERDFVRSAFTHCEALGTH